MISDEDEGKANSPRVNAPNMESNQASNNESEGEKTARQASENVPAQQSLPEPVRQRIKKSRIPRLIRGFISSARVVELAPLPAREAVAPIKSFGQRRVNTARIAQQRPMTGRPRSVEETNVSGINKRPPWASSLAVSSRNFRPAPLRTYVPNVQNKQAILRSNILRSHAPASTGPPNWSREQIVNIGSSTGVIARQSKVEVRDIVQEDEVDVISKAVQQILILTREAKEIARSSDKDEDFHSIVSSEDSFE